MRLAGDLAGTADAPTVPDLANKASLSGATFTGALASNAAISAYAGTGAATVVVGSSATTPTIRLGTSSGPTVASSAAGGSGGVIVSNTAASSTVVSVRGTSGQSTNLQDWRIGSGTPVATVTQAGLIYTSVGLRISGTPSVGQPLVASIADGTASWGIPTRAQKAVTADYTVLAADAANTMLHCTASTGVTITLPPDTTVIPAEAIIRWRQYGTGQITFAAGSGATVVSRNSMLKSAGQFAEGSLTKVAANTWLLSEDIAA